MALYRTKSNYIEAVKFTRNNIEEVKEFTNGKAKNFILEKGINGLVICDLECCHKIIKVLENKYIVKLLDGDFYICSDDSFEEKYEKVEN